MQESQVRAHQARAQQQRGFRCSASSESIPQPASVGELGTRAHGLLAAGLARAARRWKRSLRSANGNAIVVTVLRSPLALNEGPPGWAFSHPRGRLLGRLATHKPLPPAKFGARLPGHCGCVGPARARAHPHLGLSLLQIADDVCGVAAEVTRLTGGPAVVAQQVVVAQPRRAALRRSRREGCVNANVCRPPLCQRRAGRAQRMPAAASSRGRGVAERSE